MSWIYEYYVELYCYRCQRKVYGWINGTPHQEKSIGCKECEYAETVCLPTWLPYNKNTSDFDIFIDPHI